jgi:hypothetical protein
MPSAFPVAGARRKAGGGRSGFADCCAAATTTSGASAWRGWVCGVRDCDRCLDTDGDRREDRAVLDGGLIAVLLEDRLDGVDVVPRRGPAEVSGSPRAHWSPGPPPPCPQGTIMNGIRKPDGVAVGETRGPKGLSPRLPRSRARRNRRWRCPQGSRTPRRRSDIPVVHFGSCSVVALVRPRERSLGAAAL